MQSTTGAHATMCESKSTGTSLFANGTHRSRPVHWSSHVHYPNHLNWYIDIKSGLPMFSLNSLFPSNSTTDLLYACNSLHLMSGGPGPLGGLTMVQGSIFTDAAMVMKLIESMVPRNIQLVDSPFYLIYLDVGVCNLMICSGSKFESAITGVHQKLRRCQRSVCRVALEMSMSTRHLWDIVYPDGSWDVRWDVQLNLLELEFEIMNFARSRGSADSEHDRTIADNIAHRIDSSLSVMMRQLYDCRVSEPIAVSQMLRAYMRFESFVGTWNHSSRKRLRSPIRDMRDRLTDVVDTLRPNRK